MLETVLFSLALAISGPLPGQDAATSELPPPSVQDATPQNLPESRLEDVVVDGRSLRETVESFIDEVAAPPPGRSLSRWDGVVCVGVVNLRPAVAQILIDRVSSIAAEVGLEPAEPGCSPNILVVASDDADGLTRTLVETRPLAFRPPYAGAAGSRRSLANFVATSRPVRWWYVSLPVDETGAVAVRIPGYAAPKVRTLGGRLNTDIRYDLRRTFVILDIDSLEGLTFRQLGDYVAMVSLAQIDPDAETGEFQSILNLFDGAGPGAALTEWDLAYLQSLYGAELNRRSQDHQLGQVGAIMVRDRTAAQEPPEEWSPTPAP